MQTNPKVAQMKNLYFSYLAILRKVANHAALLQSTAGTSKKQVASCYLVPITQTKFTIYSIYHEMCLIALIYVSLLGKVCK